MKDKTMAIQLETSKGDFSGNAADCVAFLEDMQPSLVTARVGDHYTSLTLSEPWELSLRLAIVELTEDAGIDGEEYDWQQSLSVDQLAELVAANSQS